MRIPNSKQYMIDLLTFVDGEQAQQLRTLIDSISYEQYDKADSRYRARANNSDLQKWSFFMMSRSDERLITMSSDAKSVLITVAGYMDSHNRAMISVSLITKILDCSRDKAKHVIDELIDNDVLTVKIPSKGRRATIYEVDQELVSYGVRPQSKPLIYGMKPTISKMYVSDGDDVKTITYGELVEVETMPKPAKPNPDVVVTFKKPQAERPKISAEQLLDGLV